MITQKVAVAMRPTGQTWRNWKKREVWKMVKEGKTEFPTDWKAYWESLHGATPSSGLEEQLRLMQMEVVRLKKEAISHEMVRSEIIRISRGKPPIPEWLNLRENKTVKESGVPTLLCSDWHWGEVVDPTQVSGINQYDLTIARARVKRLIEHTINLLKCHMVNPDYPGIVMALGGDMFSGNIHEELVNTNEMPIMPVVMDLYGVLIWSIQTLADEFGRVFVPAVTGNHSRNTVKVTAKNRNHLSFDWLLYSMLEKYFENDDRVTFMVPNGSDAVYKIYNTTYCLTHGDQFRGGDGMVGAIGPILRGDHKKRSRNGQLGTPYDTLILCHFHQLMQMQRVIVNGSLIGYNEYAASGNFGYEPPRQALWITHPKNGITFQMPVLVEELHSSEENWVSWKP